MPWKIAKDGEAHRLILPLYVTHSFFTIVVNSLAQLVFGFFLEPAMGSGRFAIYYFHCGIFANLFGAAATDYYATGPEPMIFALLAGLIGMYLFYWENI